MNKVYRRRGTEAGLHKREHDQEHRTGSDLRCIQSKLPLRQDDRKTKITLAGIDLYQHANDFII